MSCKHEAIIWVEKVNLWCEHCGALATVHSIKHKGSEHRDWTELPAHLTADWVRPGQDGPVYALWVSPQGLG